MATTSDDRPTSACAEGGDTVVFGPYVVALVDFLGQASELAKWDFAPGNADQSAQWFRAVQETVGRVIAWRGRFEECFRQGRAHGERFSQQFSEGQPVEPRQRFDEFRKTSLHTAHFSDTLIFYSPLQNEYGYWQVANVASMIATYGILMLEALAPKTVFRGAIEVGMLSQFPSGDPYGPSLAKAYYLEAKIADYPRIIVGPDVLSYLDATLRNPKTDGAATSNRNVAAICREFITQDTDGCWIVDYLSEKLASPTTDPALRQQVLGAARAFVQAELDRFAQAGDEKLVARYERLLAYFRSRGVT